jgi:hypothetical protein
MIADALAANAFSATWLVGAVAFRLVLLHGAVPHIYSPSTVVWMGAYLLVNGLIPLSRLYAII